MTTEDKHMRFNTDKGWWWCMKHHRVEGWLTPTQGCPRIGIPPYLKTEEERAEWGEAKEKEVNDG